MKRLIVLAVVVLMIFSLAACGETSVTEQDTFGMELTLQDFDGYWYMDPNYPEGIHLIEIFRVDSADETYTAYDTYANELYSGGASIDGDGNLILDVDVFGELVLVPKDGALYDEDGTLGFSMGDALTAPDMSHLWGNWYLDGNVNEEYYALNDGAYRRISEYGDEYGSGYYRISAQTDISMGDPVEQTIITFGDDTFAETGTFSADFTMFYVTGFGETMTFVKQGEDGDSAIADAVIYNNDWQATDNSGYFVFQPHGSFEYYVQTITETEDGGVSVSAQTQGAGKWTLDNGVLDLVWDDGTEDSCDFTGNTFNVPSLNITVFNGVVDAGAMEMWYGTYISELGEVRITESFFDNRIDVEIYLDDDIGSMYSTDLNLEPSGTAASDEYITMRLDNGTITIEPLNEQFDNYAGTFDKQ